MKNHSLLSLVLAAPLIFNPQTTAAKEFTGCSSSANNTAEVRGARRDPVNDHLGSYNWRIEVDGIAVSEVIEGDGAVSSFDVFTENDGESEMTLELCRPELSFNPKKVALLREALAAGKVTVEMVDNETGEIAFRADYKGRIRRIRLRERDSGTDYRNRNGDNGRITENVSFTFQKIK